MIKVISLDLMGTLIDDELTKEFWYELVPKEIARIKNISFEEAVEYCKNEYKKHHDEYGPNKEWISPQYWMKKFGIKKSVEEILAKAKKKPRLYEDAIDAIELLSKKYEIVIATEHPNVFIEKNKEITNKIEKIFSSNEMNLSKLDDEFWQHIIKSLKVRSDEILHIGDDYMKDYVIPIKNGMNAFYLKRSKISLIEAIKVLKLV